MNLLHPYQSHFNQLHEQRVREGKTGTVGTGNSSDFGGLGSQAQS